MDIPARYLIAQQDLEARESERIDYIKMKVYLDNIKMLRKTGSMIPVKVTYKYRDEPYALESITTIINIPQYDINDIPTTFGEIKKIFLPKGFYDNYMLVDNYKNRIPDNTPVRKEAIYLVEKLDEDIRTRFEEDTRRKERQRRAGEYDDDEYVEDDRRRKRAREPEVVDLTHDVIDLTGDAMDIDTLDGLKKKKSPKRRSPKTRKLTRKSPRRSKRKSPRRSKPRKSLRMKKKFI
jgi:hypothetical protein